MNKNLPAIEKAIVVGFRSHKNYNNFEEDVNEFIDLVKSSGVTIVTKIFDNLKVLSAKYFAGRGKILEIAELVKNLTADVIIFNNELTPAQARNIESACNCRVIDRVELILDIFAQRAHTFEGKLQVELAQLTHLSTRLVRGWTHLERQKGGIGLRGPGETQLETDRRLINNRINIIKKKLDKVRSQRNLSCQFRKKSSIPTICLVGYTNAGKSTLFNTLLNKQVSVAVDKLFATLDPSVKKLAIADIGTVVIIDTVGFINDLPHELISAFRATLEETQLADLLLHVIDVSDANYLLKIKQVNQVLKEIHADNICTLEVYNKIDKIGVKESKVEYNLAGVPSKIWVSAESGLGVDLLKQSIAKVFDDRLVHICLQLPNTCGKQRAQLYENHAIIEEKVIANNDWMLEIKLPLYILQTIFPQDSWKNFLYRH